MTHVPCTTIQLDNAAWEDIWFDLLPVSFIQIHKVKVKVKSLSHVRLFATPWTIAHQASPSLGVSRQEYWSGLPFPSPGDLPDPGIEPRSPALEANALTSEPPGFQWNEPLKDSFLLSLVTRPQPRTFPEPEVVNWEHQAWTSEAPHSFYSIGAARFSKKHKCITFKALHSHILSPERGEGSPQTHD